MFIKSLVAIGSHPLTLKMDLLELMTVLLYMVLDLHRHLVLYITYATSTVSRISTFFLVFHSLYLAKCEGQDILHNERDTSAW